MSVAAATGATVGADTIAAAGVRTVFGVPGQRILPLVHELQNGHGVSVVLTRHEQGAAFMADAYARVAGLGCCFATSGPGATNLLTGVSAAYMDSVGVLAITAQASTDEFGRYGIQEGTGLGRTPDVSAMFAATTKDSVRPMVPDEVGILLQRALRDATSGRPGPVHVDIPSDLLLEAAAPPGEAAAVTRTPKPPAADAIEAAVARLRAAERPLLLLGNGAAAAHEAAMALAEAAHLPVAGTYLAKARLDEHHPLVLGPVGVFGRPEANHALHHEADLVLAFGVAFTYMTTAGWSLELPPERLVRVDLDPRELHNNYQPGVQVLADAGATLAALAEHVEGVHGGGRERVASLRARFEPGPVAAAQPGTMHPVELCRVLDSHLDEDVTVIADIGQNAYWTERHLRTHGDGRFLINGGLGTMGHGVVGAIGAWLALRDTGRGGRVLCTCGDGGFMMGALELSVAAAVGADVCWVIFNNGTLGTQRAWFEREGHPVVACDLPPTDHVALARSMGVAGHVAHDAATLASALDTARTAGGPHVIDVAVDPSFAPEPYTP